MHEEIQKRAASFDYVPLQNELESKESWIQYLEEDEIPLEKTDEVEEEESKKGIFEDISKEEDEKILC